MVVGTPLYEESRVLMNTGASKIFCKAGLTKNNYKIGSAWEHAIELPPCLRGPESIQIGNRGEAVTSAREGSRNSPTVPQSTAMPHRLGP